MKLKITLEGKTYEVEVEVVDESPQPLPAPPIVPRAIKPPPPPYSGGGRKALKSDDHTCRSPLAGVVSSIAVAPGQAVEKNDLLLVLEAMKMETRIFSQAPGIIRTIQVAPGDAVKPGQVLIEIE
ncbi:MAG: acetyl-CoA carboxylase biotin carboxyl carrier protein subunit [Acidobacteriota bacterium]